MFARICSRLLVLASIALPASAADFYVDVVNGNDASAGNSPATAWKTLTHASSAASSGSTTTIHVAPGTYSPGSGETFPLQFDFQNLVSDQGASTTIVDGGGINQTLVSMTSPRGSGTAHALTLLQGFTLQNAGKGVDATANWSTITTTIADCHILGMFFTAIRVESAAFGFAGGVVHLTLARTTIENVNDGVDAQATFGPGIVTIEDSTFRFCSHAALNVSTGANPTALGEQRYTLRRCRLDTNGTAGVSAAATNYGSLSGVIEDCVIVHNGAGYQCSAPNGLGNNMTVDFVRCTIADNFGVGVLAHGSTTQVFASASFASTIVDGNSPDLDVSHVTSNVFSLIGGADPLFVDRVHGVYRLQFGSLCVDQGDPTTTSGTLDVARVARAIDGDLDTQERADIGAYELQPLRLVTSGHLNTPLRLEMSGEIGGTTTVYFARSMPVSPMSTPFGQFDLNPATFGTLLHFGVAPYPPAAFQRPIPNSAILVGHTFSFQALTTSSVAPQGSAYTSVVSFTVLP